MSPPDYAPAMTSDYAPHGYNRARRRSHIYRRSQTSIPITPLPISTAALSYEIVIALPPIARCIGIRLCRCRPAHPYHKAAWLRPLAIPTYDSDGRRSQARWHIAQLTTFITAARFVAAGTLSRLQRRPIIAICAQSVLPILARPVAR